MKEEAILNRGSERITIYAEETKQPTLFNAGAGRKVSRLYLPASWAGKRVLCLLLEDPEENKN